MIGLDPVAAVLSVAKAGGRKYQLRFARERLETLRKKLLDSIDGGDECRARDTEITEWLGDVDYAIAQVKAAQDGEDCDAP